MLYEQFRAGARQAIEAARLEACRQGAGSIGVEHLFTALSEASDLPFLRELGIDRSSVSAAVESLGDRAPAHPTTRRLPLAASTKRAIQSAMKIVIRLDQEFVGCEHLLAGIVQEDDGNIGVILLAMGIDAVEFESLAFHHVGWAPSPASSRSIER